jgi:hypothetical protein
MAEAKNVNDRLKVKAQLLLARGLNRLNSVVERVTVRTT